jgi:predicted transposase/invertase (TIGR01784 family)
MRYEHTPANQFISVEILENKTFTPEIIGDKASTFDVRAVLHNSTLSPRVNVEVQLRNEYNMDKRSLFYWSREYTKNIKAGEDYHELPDVICINIIDYDFLLTQNYHTCFHLREDHEPEIILTNSLEIHYINMVKYRRTFNSRLEKKNILNDPLCRWLVWFNENSPPDLVAEVAKMDSGIQLAEDRLLYLTGDENEMRAYEQRFKAMCDWTSAQNYATETGRAEGFEKGKAEGIEKEKVEIARKMKSAGRPITEITQFTGLLPEAIKKL